MWREFTAKGHEITFSGDENILYFVHGGNYVNIYISLKTYSSVHLNLMNVAVCKVYLN